MFVHIPKTAGSSIEAWLKREGYHLDKLNYWQGDKQQHATKCIYEQWGDFDYKFTVVRNPLTRFTSALGFKTIQPRDGDRMANEIMDLLDKGKLGAEWGNHFLPQCLFVDDEVEVFKFEDNFSQQIGDRLEIPGPFPHENKSRTGVGPKDLTDATIARIKKRYERDYVRFDYE